MNCLEFRRLIGAIPRSLSAAAHAHREHCPRCAEAHIRVLGFETMLEQALTVPVSPHLADEILLRQITRHRTQYSDRHWWIWRIAAGIVLAAGISVSWLAITPSDSLAAASIEHLGHEPVSLLAHPLVAEAEIYKTFAQMGLSLTHSPGLVSYLRICPLGKYHSIHMVMQKPTGAVTVLLVPGLSIKRRNFEQQGMLGREISLDQGALVMLASNNREFDAIESSFAQTFSTRADLATGSL